MKIKYIFFVSSMVAVISSCTTAYRSGQTPDDVYYSPAPERNSYVNSINDRDRNSYSYRNDNSYLNDEEAEIRRGIRNPAYRSSIALSFGLGYSPYYSPFGYSPFGYSPYYSPYGFGSYYGYDPYMSHSLYNPYFYNSYGYGGLYNPYSFYNPYSLYGFPHYGYYPGIISYRNVNTNTGARRYNLNPYNSISNSPAAIRNAVRSNIASGSSAPVRSFNTRPSSTGNGNVIRREMNSNSSQNRRTIRNSNRTYQSNNNNNYNTREERPTYQAPTRSFDSSPSSGSPSSSGSSNSSSAPVRSFRR